MCLGGGGYRDCNASLSQPNVQKKQQSPREGEGGGLKFEKKNNSTARGGGGVLSFFFIRRLGPSI